MTAVRNHLPAREAMLSGLGLLVFAGWCAATVAVWGRFVIPPRTQQLEMLLLYGVPAVAVALVLVGPQWARRAAPVAGAMVVVAFALAAAPRLLQYELVILGLPALIASAWATHRWPAAAIGGVFLITGTHGSITAFTPLPPRTFADLLMGGLWLGLVVGLILRHRRGQSIIWPSVALAVAFAVTALLWVPFSPSFDPAMKAWRKSMWYLLAIVFVAYAGWSRATIDRIVKIVVLTGLLVGAYATLRWIIGPAPQERNLVYEFGNPIYNTVAIGQEKVQGSLPDGVSLGSWVTVVMPFCAAMALAGRGRTRMFAIASLPLLAIALLGSQLRAGVVAVGAGILVAVLVHQMTRGLRGPQIGMAVASVVVLSVGSMVIFPIVLDTPEKRQRYSNILHPERDQSFQERVYKWRNAIEDIERYPLGHGLGTGGSAALQTDRFVRQGNNEVDNSYLRIAYEQGMVAMVVYAIMLFILLAALVRRAVWTRANPAVVIGAAGTLTSYAAVMGTTLVVERFDALAAWIIIGLGIAQFSRRDEDEDEAQAGPARTAAPAPA